MATTTPKEWTVLSMLDWATAYFSEKGIPSPRLSIEWLLAEVLHLKRLDLYLNFDRPLKTQELSDLKELIKRRAKHEPLQYIIGETDFYASTFKVNQNVLIPRPETEELVEQILQNHSNKTEITLLDIGTGSGCIAISLKKERPNWNVFAVDISPEALRVAKENAILNSVNVEFELGNLFADSILDGKQFDIIVSNPPYIDPAEAIEMHVQVKKYEPHLALFVESPIRVYQAIEMLSKKQLAKSNTAELYLELNENLANSIEHCFSTDYWDSTPIKDLSGKDRMLLCRLRRR